LRIRVIHRRSIEATEIFVVLVLLLLPFAHLRKVEHVGCQEWAGVATRRLDSLGHSASRPVLPFKAASVTLMVTEQGFTAIEVLAYLKVGDVLRLLVHLGLEVVFSCRVGHTQQILLLLQWREVFGECHSAIRMVVPRAFGQLVLDRLRVKIAAVFNDAKSVSRREEMIGERAELCLINSAKRRLPFLLLPSLTFVSLKRLDAETIALVQ